MNPEDLNTITQETEHAPRLSRNMAAMVVVAIIVVVLALMYLWAKKASETDLGGAPQKGNTLTEEELSAVSRPGTDEDAAALNTSVALIRLDTIDEDLNALEADLNAMVAE